MGGRKEISPWADVLDLPQVLVGGDGPVFVPLENEPVAEGIGLVEVTRLEGLLGNKLIVTAIIPIQHGGVMLGYPGQQHQVSVLVDAHG